MRGTNVPGPARLIVLGVAVVMTAVACSGTAKTPQAAGKTPAPTIRPHSDPKSTPEPRGGDNDILVVRENGAGAAGYQAIFGGTGEKLFRLPEGAPSKDWHTVATTQFNGGSTTVSILSGEGGDVQRSVDIDGSWRLPRVGLAGTMSGLSADGRVLVLEEDRAASPADRQTRFAVVDATGKAKTRVISLQGAFSFDALSPRGNWLYLIQHGSAGGPTYQVRRVATATGELDEAVIVDKRNPDEVMQGYAVTQQAGANGYVYTLYRGGKGAFVHALDTENGGAFCIDLPDTEDESNATAAGWGLALALKGPSLYAANGKSGKVFEIDLTEFEVARSGSLPRQTGAIELVKFESGAWSVAGAVALDADGEVLFVAGDQGVIAVRTSDLSVVSMLDAGRAYRSVVVGGSGVVYGTDSQGALMRLGSISNPFTQPLAETGYASIEAIVTFR